MIKFTILGCSSSRGVPLIGGEWGDCDPDNPKNRRMRCSMLVQKFSADGGKVTNVLIDSGPDVYHQLVMAKIRTLDAVVYTHLHSDHLHGIGDLRQVSINNNRVPVPAYMGKDTYKAAFKSFSFCFQNSGLKKIKYPSIVEYRPIVARQEFEITGAGGGLNLLPVLHEHGDINSFGFRIGDLMYSCDLNNILPQDAKLMRGLEWWIVDALRLKPHPGHFNLDEALKWIDIINPKRAVLTDMDISLDYETLCNQLPEHIRPAYDGMVIEQG